jgi:thymidylate synthase
MIQSERVIQGYDVNTMYRQALSRLLNLEPGPSPRGQATREILGQSLLLSDASRCLLTWPERKLNYHFAVAEWWWIATGRSDVASITPFCSEIAKFSDDGQSFFGAYGPPWTAQADYVVKKLRQDIDTRQAVATIWRQSPPETKDVPCTVSMQYLCRDGTLHAIVTMRSSDAWLGLPYDTFNFARLLALVAGEIGLPVGSLRINAGSFHLYERNVEKARELLNTAQSGIVETLPAHPRVAPPLDALPGLVPASLSGQAMDGTISSHDWGFPADRFESYLSVLRHRFDKSTLLNEGVWSELLA